MNQEIKAAWISWLENPEHEKGVGHLLRNGQYCCLGGLCEVAMQMGVPIQWQRTSDGAAGTWEVAGRTGYLPPEVQQWSGLNVQDPSVIVGDRPMPLSVVNDTGDFTFPEIAILIKEHL